MSEDEELSKFERFLNIIRGKVDVKNRLSLLLNPANPKTSTQLSRNEVDFVSLSLFVAEEFEEFNPLKTFALEFCQVSISREGWGVESSIRLNSAISESKLFRDLTLKQGEAKAKVK